MENQKKNYFSNKNLAPKRYPKKKQYILKILKEEEKTFQ
jgi:hypothetical protein